MKLLILALFIAISQLAFSQSMQTWTTVDLLDFKNNKQIQSLQQFGVPYVIAQGIELKKLPNTTLIVSQTIKVARRLEGGVNYRFDIELRDPKHNKTGHRVNYIVNYRSWDNFTQVTSFSFDPLPDGTEDEPFKIYINPTKVDGDLYIEGLLEFGIQYMASHPVPNGPDASYRLHKIVAVQQIREDPFRLWILVQLVSNKGPNITLEIEFFDDPWLEQVIVQYFNVHDILYVNETDFEKANLDFPITLTPEEFHANDFNMQDLFKYAVESSLELGVQKGIFSSTAYTLYNIWNASIDREKNDVYYRFSATLQMEGFGAVVVIAILKNEKELFSYRVDILEIVS